MTKFALIGDSIQHSLSPLLFRAAYKEYSKDLDYILIESKDINNALEIVRSNNIRGFNVTSPFKESILKFCEFIHPSAHEAKSANTVIVLNNKLHAYNTDIQGVSKTLIDYNLYNQQILIIGGGGAAMSAAYATKKCNTKIANRTYEKAKSIANNLNIEAIKICDLVNIDLSHMVVIYTIDHKIDNLDSLNFSKSYIFEANYKNPNLKTLDCINYIGGEEWLINQAIPAFKLFTGIEPNLDAINKVINRD